MRDNEVSETIPSILKVCNVFQAVVVNLGMDPAFQLQNADYFISIGAQYADEAYVWVGTAKFTTNLQQHVSLPGMPKINDMPHYPSVSGLPDGGGHRRVEGFIREGQGRPVHCHRSDH